MIHVGGALCRKSCNIFYSKPILKKLVFNFNIDFLNFNMKYILIDRAKP